MYKQDLRDFIKQVQQLDECRVVEGANWDEEIGLITEMGVGVPDGPMLLFDKIKDYQAGYRILTNFLTTSRRAAIALGLPLNATKLNLVNAWREKVKNGSAPIPPVKVSTGPCKENIHRNSEIDLFEFPVPKWHADDGGRYIGTGHLVIQKDPDTGWVNVGTYRVQIHDKSTATIHIIGAHHGDIIARKYWERGLPCPVAVVCGEDPLLWTASSTMVPWGTSEYDHVGRLRNEPLQVVSGEVVDLPIPANAEIVLEGEFVPQEIESKLEGPFGEWQGYYSGGRRPHPVFRVKAITHRNNPIILGAPPMLPTDADFGTNIIKAAALWDEMDKHVPGIKGVWFSNEARGGRMPVISIQQLFPGHAKQTALVAAALYQGGPASHKLIIIVDEDIDPSNNEEVLWALGTRCDPKTSIDIIGECQSMASDPRLPPEKRESGNLVDSRAFIYACRPYSWIKKFPKSIKSSPESLQRIRDKWGSAVFGKPDISKIKVSKVAL